MTVSKHAIVGAASVVTKNVPDYSVAVGWLFATSLSKQWDATIPYLHATWTHNKTIQKACESYRIKPEQKDYLKTLKIK